jgi:hypothetical protein
MKQHLLSITTALFFSLTLFSQVENVQDDFEGNGNITSWTEDNCNINTAFSNPYPIEINTSNTVLEYRDTGGQYANIRFQLSENFNLLENSTFSLKIYVPSSSITGSQPNQISLKLQDGSLGQPWVTQSEIIKPIVLNKWQNITFNFATDNYINFDENSANPVTRTDFNRVVLQVNSENNTDLVKAYLDDFFYSSAPAICGEQTNSDTFTNSNLPIVIINTENGAEILDDPRIYAAMKIIERPNGARNYLCDADNEDYLDYSGTISIEIRGSSSQTIAKKPYGLTTLSDDRLENDNVKLLGMPKENDWILNSFAFDDSMMRDFISYEMARKMGQYAANLKYCEVVLNGDYIGLYALSEKIKRDGDRVDISKLSDTENSFPEITGGYLIQTDRTDADNPEAWNNNGASYIHEKPNSDEITAEQSSYIESVFRNLDNTASNSNIINGYPAVIDVPSFVDYMLMAEITSNADVYALSTYYHKGRGGKLRAGPIWDYNLTFGNDLGNMFGFYFDRSHTNVWQFNYSNTGANFWGDLFADPTFKCYLSKRFDTLTKTGEPLNNEYVSNLIDDTVALISEAVAREDERWNTIDNFSGEITNLKTWLQERITWMKNNLGNFSNCNSVETPNLVITKIHYNPQETTTFPESDDLEFIEIKNAGNTVVNLTGIYLEKLGISYQFPQNTTIAASNSYYLASNAISFKNKYGFAPFGSFSRDLSNKSHHLVLADAFGNVIDQVEYLDKAPWPETADGDGDYLELLDINSDNSLASNWVASSQEVLSTNSFVANNINFNIYPNPVNSKLTIKAQQTIEKIIIYNPLGQQIKAFQVNFKSGVIDISELDKGIYYLKLKHVKGNNYSTKIIKQ